MPEPGQVLIIDDDRLFCDVIADHLRAGGLGVRKAHSGGEGLAACSSAKIDVVLLDQNLPDAEGHSLCPAILSSNEQAKIIFITAHPSFEGAVKAIKAGAYDYLSKPFELDELSLAISKAFRTQELEKIAQIEEYRTVKEREDAVLVDAGGLHEVNRLADLAAGSSAPVLITGETGTGKNVVAKAIHFRSAARGEAFIGINCAALPENLVEAELFGYEKGAFTGASGSKKGIFETAEGGTFFLDEIGAMPLNLQSKLLGVLEEKKIRRLGSGCERPVNVRIIAATNADLERELGRTFRADLYYRLSVIRIHIPPLRERRQDIPLLCSHLLAKIGAGKGVTLSEAEVQRLTLYLWPGNVRELRNILERAFLLRDEGELKPSRFIARAEQAATNSAPAPSDAILPMVEMEKIHIRRALEILSGNYAATARALGISLSTLKRKVRAFGLK